MPTTILLDDPVACPADQLEPARSLIAACPFRFARHGNLGGAPVTESPHEYCVRAWLPDGRRAEFDRFSAVIAAHGYRGRFLSSTYGYLNVDGWRYRTSPSYYPAGDVILNRADNERAPMRSSPP